MKSKFINVAKKLIWNHGNLSLAIVLEPCDWLGLGFWLGLVLGLGAIFLGAIVLEPTTMKLFCENS